MKSKPLVLVLALTASFPALAAPSLVYEATAEVLSATPLTREVPITGRVCDDAQAPAAKDSSPLGTVLGGLVGGLLGNQIGEGSGKKAAIAAGAITGALAGNSVGSQSSASVRCRETVTGYRTVSDGYRIRWQLHDQVRESMLPRDPGNTLRVRVSLQPISNF